MFSQYLGVLLILSLLIAIRECQVDQGDVPLSCTNPNEEPNECGPACGDRNCTNQSKNNIICTKECKAGCFCKGGYVRNSRQVCVPSYMCGTG